MALFPSSGDENAQIPWSWVWGLCTAVVTGAMGLMFKLAWRGAMADFDARLRTLEREVESLQTRRR